MIYLYKLNDRTWADLSKPDGARVIRKIHVNTRKKCLKVIANPGKILPGRIISLAERVLADMAPKNTFWNRVKKAGRVLRGVDG